MCALRALVGMVVSMRLAVQEDVMVEPLGVPAVIFNDEYHLSTAGTSERRKLVEQPESIIPCSQGL